MINIYEVNETNNMIEHENLDVRTITLGISLLSCISSDLESLKKNIYEKITSVARDLVATGKAIENDFGMANTERVCSSVNVGSTKTGLNMDAVNLMGRVVKQTAEATKDDDSLGCAKLVVFCNAPDDNPVMAGAFHGVTEADAVINVGVSGPGVVKVALE